MRRLFRASACLLMLLPLLASAATPKQTDVRQHVVRIGDTWSELAQRYWGNARLAPELAHFAAPKQEKLRPGQTLRIPGLGEHRIAAGETLLGISRGYGGGDRFAHARALASINQIRNARALKVGQRIRVPVFEPVKEAQLPAVSLTPKTRQESNPSAKTRDESLSDGLRFAINAYVDGSYETALARLEKLRTPVLATGSVEERVRLLRTLVYLYVAYDRLNDACATDLGLRAIAPGENWDGDLVSPKVVDALRRCHEG